MSKRIETFRSYAKHIVHAKVMAQLSHKDIADCLKFIQDNDHLDRNGFALKVNRWLIDQPKPKRYSAMWALVSQCNSREEI